MKAVVVEKHGPPESLVIREKPVPEPGPGEALVKVRACALNHLDTWVRRGVPGHAFPLPLVPGSDVAGELAGGWAPGLSIGDPVVVAPFTSCGVCEWCLSGQEVRCRSYAILGESRDGGCAEYVTVPSGSVFPKPGNLSFVQAASILLAPLTAFHMVKTRAGVRAGERVLVTAAAGGVGTAAVQIAADAGAEVVGVVGADEKRDAVSALGASDVVVVPGGGTLHEEVRARLGKASFDVVVDSVGAGFFESAIRLLKPFGRLVTCGSTAGGEAKLDLRRLFFLSLSVLGSTMGSRWELAEVLKMAATGRFKPSIHAVFPLENTADAHRVLEERRVVGKVVIEVS